MINKLQNLREARRKSESGFTIIEVLIVLAIAGLIMLIVFLAVPALNRNSQNTSRRSDATHLAGLINEYASNHAGTFPTAYGTAAGQVDISQEKWAIMQTPVSTNMGSNNNVPAAGTNDVMYVNLGRKCDQATGAIQPGNNRTFAISFRVATSSGDQPACING